MIIPRVSMERPPLQSCVSRFAQMRADRDRMIDMYVRSAPMPRFIVHPDRLEDVSDPDSPKRAKLKEVIQMVSLKIAEGEMLAKMPWEKQSLYAAVSGNLSQLSLSTRLE